jgi:hypothetical protein
MRKIISAIFIIIIVFSFSCQKTLDPGTTIAPKAANGWWVTFQQDGVDIGGGHFFFNTYNTSANDDSLWLDDLGHAWNFKCKTKIDFQNLTFSVSNSNNEYYPITVNVANGKILPKAGTSKGGNKTDSIYMELNFSDDPANTYVITGTARTGFIEDDY